MRSTKDHTYRPVRKQASDSMVSRRRVTSTALWGTPAVAVAAAAPAFAGSVRTLTVTSPTILPMQYVAEPVGIQLTAVDESGQAPVDAVWTATGLPAGLTLSPEGLITGTATVADEHQLVVTVTSGSTSQTVTLVLPVGNERADVTQQMLERINAHRAQLGLTVLTRDAALDGHITPWVEHLADLGGRLVHQSPVVYAENLSSACYAPGALGTLSDTALGDRLVDGWLSEPHSYAEWKALQDAGQTAEADDMYYGRGAYTRASGHRINIENPSYSTIGLGTAASVEGSACGGTWTTGEYGGIVLDG